MRVNQIVKFRKSAAKCLARAQQTRDSRAKAVLAVAADVWEKLAEQRANHVKTPQVGTLLDLLDTTFNTDRDSR
jgi:uncharacterized protein (DUF2384 family)